MRSFVIVVPHKAVNRATAGAEGEQRLNVEALVVDGAKEALDLAVGLRRIGADQVVPNGQRLAALLEAVRRSAWYAWRMVNAKALSVSTASTR